MKKAIIVVSAIIGFNTMTVEANNQQRHDRRQNAQKARIHEGVKSGELTRKEARQLRLQQKRVQRLEQQAEADGNVTPEEKRQIERHQNRLSKNIYQQKHDKEKRNNQNSDTPQESNESDDLPMSETPQEE